MNYTDITFKVPQSAGFFEDCLQHSVCLRTDMIEDSSWRRFLSDKPVQWMFENFGQAREALFVSKNHVMTSENERWRGKTFHIEAGFTVRINNNTDYILRMEIDPDWLSYFTEKYLLEKV